MVSRIKVYRVPHITKLKHWYHLISYLLRRLCCHESDVVFPLIRGACYHYTTTRTLIILFRLSAVSYTAPPYSSRFAYSLPRQYSLISVNTSTNASINFCIKHDPRDSNSTLWFWRPPCYPLTLKPYFLIVVHNLTSFKQDAFFW